MRPSAETIGVPEPLAASIVRRLAEGKLELPMLPEVAGEVVALCSSTDADAASLSELLRRDQALASNVLRVANSPAYMPAVPIASLQQAVSRLGMRQVSEIAMAVSVRSNLFQDGSDIGLLRALWRHSVAAGFYAKEIARARRRSVDTAFLCGLLHDVGKPVLLANLRSLLDDVGLPANPEVRNAVLDHFHAEAGVALADRWKLPPQIRAAIVHHHDWTAAADNGEAATMACLADLLAHLALPGGVEVDVEELRGHPVLVALNLYPDELEQLIGEADSLRESVEALC